MYNNIKQIIKRYFQNNIYLAFVKRCSKLNAIKYIFSRSKYLDKSTLIIFALFKITLITKRISNLFKF